MDPSLKKILKALSLGLRHLLEGWYDAGGAWHAGDLEQRLAGLGVWRGREPLPADEFGHMPAADRAAREVVDAYLALRREAGVSLADAVAEFVRETAYTWANRLLALRCMEARALIDEVILQREAYAGRSLEHHRLIRRQPELAVGEDDGLYAALDAAFARQAERKLALFDPRAPAVALKPSVAALRRCVALLSGTEPLRGVGAATDEVFQAHDALGWAYQYYQEEEKGRVDEWLKTKKGFKCEGIDIVAKTALYTEAYMVKFLVQNSLGAMWMAMHPRSRLCEKWEYYVRDANRAPVTPKPVREFSFLDPATGSGHFHLEAFDLFYDMYLEEGEITDPAAICAAILAHNLYGIDIDERAIQIAEAALWMKAAERAFDFPGAAMNLVATNIRLPKGKDHLQAFLAKHPEDYELRPALEAIFEGMAHADELGSLLQIEEPVERELRYLQVRFREQTDEPEQLVLLPEMRAHRQGTLPPGLGTYEQWKTQAIDRLKSHFEVEVETADPRQAFFGESAKKAVMVFDLLTRQYDVVSANPPYLGSKKQGETLKAYVGDRYQPGKYDLFAAFILRSLQLARSPGWAALVTQRTWMFLRYFAGLREMILNGRSISHLADLGEKAFSDPAAAGAFVALSVFTTHESAEIPVQAIDLTLMASCDDKASELSKSACLGSRRWLTARTSTFKALPEFIIRPTITEKLRSVISESRSLREEARVTDAVVVVQRFVQFWWEHPYDHNKWLVYSKGGGYSRWAGLDWYDIEWSYRGIRLKSYVLSRYPPSKFRLIVKSEETIGQPGLTWTTLARGKLAGRLILRPCVVSSKGPGVFPKEDDNRFSISALLNSRLGSYLMRVISPGLEFGYRYVELLPIPSAFPARLSILARTAYQAAFATKTGSLIERDFSTSRGGSLHGTGLYQIMASFIRNDWGHSRRQLMAEEEIEELIIGAYGLGDDEVEAVYRAVGAPLRTPPHVESIARSSERNLLEYLHGRSLESSDASGEDDLESGEDDDFADITVLSDPLPADSDLENICAALGWTPDQLLAIFDKMAPSSLRGASLLVRYTADYASEVVLRLLGHRWPKQLEAGEPVPDWADPDGIIPLTEGVGEPTLHERVRERLAAEFPGGSVTAIEAEFAEIMGKPLAQWLTHDFSKHHTSQFKKRPIAWQIGSARFTARRLPAFACLVYYHKLDGNTLASIQSQYVRPLRRRYETELRGIEAIPAAARSERQVGRRIELEGWIAELREFDDKLGQVAAKGFAGDALARLIAQEPVDSWCSIDGIKPRPADPEALLRQEMAYIPDLNDGVRVNIAPLQKAGLLAADVIAGKDVEKAIADRADWRADERRWCREGKLPRPGWWRGDAGTR